MKYSPTFSTHVTVRISAFKKFFLAKSGPAGKKLFDIVTCSPDEGGLPCENDRTFYYILASWVSDSLTTDVLFFNSLITLQYLNPISS